VQHEIHLPTLKRWAILGSPSGTEETPQVARSQYLPTGYYFVLDATPEPSLVLACRRDHGESTVGPVAQGCSIQSTL